MTKTRNGLYYATLFRNIQGSFKNLLNDDFICFKNIIDAVNAGVIDPDLSIAENVNKFVLRAKSDTEIMATKEFSIALENFNDLLKGTEKDVEKLNKIYNVKLIELILSKKLVPYNQVDITRMYFLNPNKNDEEKIKFLDAKIDAIFNGGNDFRMIYYLDKIAIAPEFLKNSFMYQELIHHLIINYVENYNKYCKKSKLEDKRTREIIRMVYRHQNKGYHKPEYEDRDAIISTYGFNAWLVELKHMIITNSLGITKDNYIDIIEVLKKSLLDMAIVCESFEEESEDKETKVENKEFDYVKMSERFDELYELVTEVALGEMKLVRKEG